MALTKVSPKGTTTISSGWDAFNDLIDDLASTSSSLGASCIGIQDSDGNLDATTVEAAIAEIYDDIDTPVTVAAVFDENSATTTGLTWGYKAGSYTYNGTLSNISVGTVALTDDTTNYVEIDPTDNTVKRNTTGFTDGRIPLRQVVTASGSQSTSTDKRSFFSHYSFTSSFHTGFMGTSANYASLSSASYGSAFEFSRSTTTTTDKIGAIQWINDDNADGTNNDADGKNIASIIGLMTTSDSNAGDDSGGYIEFYTKPEAGSLTKALTIASDQTVTFVGTFTGITGSTIGNLTLANGSITDSSGAISFGNENLSTTGTLSSGTHTVGNTTVSSTSIVTDTTLTLEGGSITDSSGAISFGNENLSTTGTLSSGTHTIGTLVLAAASITDTGGSISFGNENLSTTGTLGAGATTVTTFTSTGIDDNASSTTITIESANRVGINNTDAQTIDAVNSGGNLVVGSGSGTEGMTVYSGNANWGYYYFADGTTTTATYEGWVGYNHGSNLMTIGTNHTTALTIDSSQNVGIGVTPEAWDSTYTALQIGTLGSLNATSTDCNLTNNAYYDDTDNRWEYITTTPATRIWQTNGQIYFEDAASGTADTAISWRVKMYITNQAAAVVALGGTASTWYSTQNVLHLSGSAVVHGDTGSVYMGENYYINASGTQKLIGNGAASLYQQGNGVHYFYVETSGTADDTISWTTALTIANDGTLTNSASEYLTSSDGGTGGSGSAGAGNQYIELNVNGTTYKVLHDGTV